MLSVSPDGKLETGLRACTPGRFTSAREGFAETCSFLEGLGRLVNDHGTTVALEAGVLIALPNGWRGVWEIDQALKKVYTIACS